MAMTPQERHDLVDAYLKHLEYLGHRPSTERIESDPWFEAWEEVSDLCGKDPETALSVLLELIDRCKAEDLYRIGAGPVEELVYQHAVEFAERIERLLRTNDRFLEAYQCVRMGGVPLTIQRQLNDVLVERGVPRNSLMEFPESYDFD
jgi:hypothetical protein